MGRRSAINDNGKQRCHDTGAEPHDPRLQIVCIMDAAARSLDPDAARRFAVSLSTAIKPMQRAAHDHRTAVTASWLRRPSPANASSLTVPSCSGSLKRSSTSC